MEEALILPVYDYALLVGVNDAVEGLRFNRIGLVPWLYETHMSE